MDINIISGCLVIILVVIDDFDQFFRNVADIKNRDWKSVVPTFIFMTITLNFGYIVAVCAVYLLMEFQYGRLDDKKIVKWRYMDETFKKETA